MEKIKGCWDMSKRKHQIGNRYCNKSGYWYTLVKYINTQDVVVEFDPPYSTVVESKVGYLSSHGGIKNPLAPNTLGCWTGVGEYNSVDHSKAHTCWFKMFDRVVKWERNKRNKGYKDCTICEEWKNFQVFAAWYYNQAGCDLNWHIEKDLLIKGNKHYSPETCIFVPPDVNMFLTRRESCRNGLIGVHYRAKTGRYLSAFTRDGVTTHIGSYATEMEAHLAYKREKEKYAKVLAEKYKDQLGVKAYEALINYVVDITD